MIAWSAQHPKARPRSYILLVVVKLITSTFNIRYGVPNNLKQASPNYWPAATASKSWAIRCKPASLGTLLECRRSLKTCMHAARIGFLWPWLVPGFQPSRRLCIYACICWHKLASKPKSPSCQFPGEDSSLGSSDVVIVDVTRSRHRGEAVW